MEIWQRFLLAWVPLFVVIDPIGIVPIFLAMTEGAGVERRRRIAHQAAWTAALVAVGFMFLGKVIFRALGITVADFQIAGGLVLVGVGSRELLFPERKMPHAGEGFGVVPLGLPLIVGPATLTTLLILSDMDTVGPVYTLAALLVNLLLVVGALRYSERLASWVGLNGLRAISKIVALLLVAIAIHMIRLGLKAG
jgi:multiple antibiotic resistance protein